MPLTTEEFKSGLKYGLKKHGIYSEKVFGLSHLKKEGFPIHPDDMGADMTITQYRRQLAAYKWYVLRPHLKVHRSESGGHDSGDV